MLLSSPGGALPHAPAASTEHGDSGAAQEDWTPCPPAQMAPPRPGFIHVWHIDLDAAAQALDQDALLLDAAERRRADAFATDRLRARYIAAHAALRRILAASFGSEPASLVFDAGPWGRPRLAGRKPPLDFNLSHSAGIALVAVTTGGRVGIDLEQIRPDPPLEILPEICTAGERALLAALPARRRASAFYELWTRKEALVKAIGPGLHMDPRSLHVMAGKTAPATINGWSVRGLGPLPDTPGFPCAAALASREPAATVLCRRYGR